MELSRRRAFVHRLALLCCEGSTQCRFPRPSHSCALVLAQRRIQQRRVDVAKGSLVPGVGMSLSCPRIWPGWIPGHPLCGHEGTGMRKVSVGLSARSRFREYLPSPIPSRNVSEEGTRQAPAAAPRKQPGAGNQARAVCGPISEAISVTRSAGKPPSRAWR